MDLSEGAPYDRILATCAITHIPPEWIRQLAEGGRVVAPIAGNLSKPLLVLDKTAPDEVTGHFDNHTGGFMPLRHDLRSPFGPGETAGSSASGMAHYGTTTTDPRRLHEASPELALFCQLHVPGLRLGYDTDSPHCTDRTRARGIIAYTADALATVSFHPENGRWPVVQRGPYRIWDTIETALAFGITCASRTSPGSTSPRSTTSPDNTCGSITPTGLTPGRCHCKFDPGRLPSAGEAQWQGDGAGDADVRP